MATAAHKPDITPQEWEARQQLAACYRIFDHMGWSELIYNHITLRVPGEDSAFLINPFGLGYHEVTASNLVKIDIDGHVLDGSPYPVNRAGFTQHGVFHRHLPDAHCIIHTHTTQHGSSTVRKAFPWAAITRQNNKHIYTQPQKHSKISNKLLLLLSPPSPPLTQLSYGTETRAAQHH